MNNTEAPLQMVNRIPAGKGIRMDVSGLVPELNERQHRCGIDVEIVNRLRNLGQDSVMVESVDCRSRFSSTRIEQVRIRMRLKQVAGSVTG